MDNKQKLSSNEENTCKSKPPVIQWQHNTENGCRIYKSRTEKILTGKKDLGHRLEIWYCPQHKVEICRCGYEWGGHSCGEVYNYGGCRALIKIILNE